MIDKNDPSTFVTRKLDYLLKGLSGKVSGGVCYYLDEVGVYNVKQLMEKEEDYPSLRRLGFDDEEIKNFCHNVGDKFNDVNKYLEENDRYPFFEDPYDSYRSAKEYVDIMTERPYEELVEFFGVKYEDYVPRSLKKDKEQDSPSKD